MGNSKSCVDGCGRNVPILVRGFKGILFRSDGRANGFYRFFTSNTWIKIDDSRWLCPYCLQRRAENERREEENRQRRERERRAAQEARQRKEQEQRRKASEEVQRRRAELDLKTNDWLTKQKKFNVLGDSHLAHQTKAFDRRTNPLNIESKFLHATANQVKGADTCNDQQATSAGQFKRSRIYSYSENWNHFSRISEDNDVTRDRQRKNGRKQKYEQAAPGKSVSDLTWEMMPNLSTSDARETNIILDEVSKQIEISRFQYLRKPYPSALHHILETKARIGLKDPCAIIIVICNAVKRTKGYWPRSTQLVSLCLLIKSFQQGRLLEIKTGEGKSCIIAMFAVFLALSGRSVDIVTSSPILAVRDAEEWREFYREFQIEAACNLIPEDNNDRLKCYKNPVVYGTVGSFTSDILRHEFLMEEVRGNRTFDAVIVDEVDSMLLDKGINFTYLSSPAPGMHHIQPILLMIWNEVIRHPVVQSDQGQNYFVGKPEALHVVLDMWCGGNESLYSLEKNGVLRNGFITDVQDEAQNEGVFAEEMTKEKMKECLQWVESNYCISIEMFEMYDETTIHRVNKHRVGKQAQKVQLLVVGEGLVCVLYQDQKTLCELIQTKIQSFLTTGCQEEKECCYEFPSYLSDFVRNRLPKWIENAFLAISMTEGREYLIKDREIIPVDFESTGVVELNTKWGDGLHQFLELKHQMKLSQMTLVTNFMSNQAFFKRYPGKLFGLTGTLGSEAELTFLQEYYGLSYLKIPTYREKRFSEDTGILCSSKDDWLMTIKEKVGEHTSSSVRQEKRAVLIICEDINTAKEVKESLTTLSCNSVTLFTENDEEKAVAKKLKGGDVIIATNIAGRGTDIEVTESVVEAGGLFVLVTFLPSNSRVEDQVFGRCARQGQPGSAQLIINQESLPLCLKIESFSNIQKLKEIREEDAKRRQESNEQVLHLSTMPKEDLFSMYCRLMRGAASQLKDESEFERKILLSSMHEFWGLWLKMNCENLKDLNEGAIARLKAELKRKLHTAKRQIMSKASPCANLYHIIKFANQRRIENKLEEAYELYTRAIESDKTWAAIAYYNRAYCRLLQRKDGYMEAAISDLEEAKKGLQKYMEEVIFCLSFLSILPKDTKSANESTRSVKSQFDTRGQILSFYEENIETALKKLAELKKDKKDAKAVGHNALTIALGDDKLCKKLDSELHVFWNLGLTDTVTIEEKWRFNWKAALVVFLGVVEIAVGGFLVACSSGLLLNIAWGLVTEGINDICTGAFALYKGHENFVKSWAIGKVASIAMSIATFGFGHVKSAFQGTKGLKSALTVAKENIETAAKGMWETLKEIPQQVSSKSFPAAMGKACEEVAVYAVKEVGTRSSKYVLESVNDKLKTNFENETRKQLKKELNKAMKATGEFKDSLDKFIFIHSRNGKKKEEVSDEFMKIHKEMLESTNTIGQLRGILTGCVKSLLRGEKNKMEENNPGVFRGLVSPILEIADSCQKQSSVNVKRLVSVYCEHTSKALKEIYAGDFEGIAEGDLQRQTIVVSNAKDSMSSRIVDHLFQMIQNSFESTTGGLVIEKLQDIVDAKALKFSEANGVGKSIMRDIISISMRDGRAYIEA